MVSRGAGGEGGVNSRRPAANREDRAESERTPIEVFDGFRKALAANRASSISTSPLARSMASIVMEQGSRDDAELVATGMIGSAKAHYEGIKAFRDRPDGSLSQIALPVLVMQGDRSRSCL